jgi:hypothetical protein
VRGRDRGGRGIGRGVHVVCIRKREEGEGVAGEDARAKTWLTGLKMELFLPGPLVLRKCQEHTSIYTERANTRENYMSKSRTPCICSGRPRSHHSSAATCQVHHARYVLRPTVQCPGTSFRGSRKGGKKWK